MFGGAATQLDAFTRALLGNADVLALNGHSTRNRQISAREGVSAVWAAEGKGGAVHAALFNRLNSTARGSNLRPWLTDGSSLAAAWLLGRRGLSWPLPTAVE